MASIIIDDQDASVTYSGSWLRYGGKFEHDSTTSLAISPGLQASLRFTGKSLHFCAPEKASVDNITYGRYIGGRLRYIVCHHRGQCSYNELPN